MADETFYQPISNILEVEALPDQLGFVKDGITNLLSNIYYRDLQYSKNTRGDAAFYSLSIVSKQRIDIDIPGTGMSIILNPSHDPLTQDISEFPITLSYEWGILSYLRSFNLANFSFNGAAFFDLATRILGISETNLIS